MSEDESPVRRPSEQGSPEESRPKGESLPTGRIKWWYDHLRRLATISSDVGRLVEENKRLRATVNDLAKHVNTLATKVDMYDKLIEAKVELEVRRRLDGSPGAK